MSGDTRIEGEGPSFQSPGTPKPSSDTPGLETVKTAAAAAGIGGGEVGEGRQVEHVSKAKIEKLPHEESPLTASETMVTSVKPHEHMPPRTPHRDLSGSIRDLTNQVDKLREKTTNLVALVKGFSEIKRRADQMLASEDPTSAQRKALIAATEKCSILPQIQEAIANLEGELLGSRSLDPTTLAGVKEVSRHSQALLRECDKELTYKEKTALRALLGICDTILAREPYYRSYEFVKSGDTIPDELLKNLSDQDKKDLLTVSFLYMTDLLPEKKGVVVSQLLSTLSHLQLAESLSDLYSFTAIPDESKKIALTIYRTFLAPDFMDVNVRAFDKALNALSQEMRTVDMARPEDKFFAIFRTLNLLTSIAEATKDESLAAKLPSRFIAILRNEKLRSVIESSEIIKSEFYSLAFRLFDNEGFIDRLYRLEPLAPAEVKALLRQGTIGDH